MRASRSRRSRRRDVPFPRDLGLDLIAEEHPAGTKAENLIRLGQRRGPLLASVDPFNRVSPQPQ